MKQTINTSILNEQERLDLVRLLAKCGYAVQITKHKPTGASKYIVNVVYGEGWEAAE